MRSMKMSDELNIENLTDKIIAETEEASAQFDPVNHPAHYTEGRKYEPIKVIQDWKLDFCLGNAVKYISRCGRKDSKGMTSDEKALQDLEKARFYLNYKIDEMKEQLSVLDKIH